MMFMRNRAVAVGSLAALLIGVLVALGAFTKEMAKAPAPEETRETRAAEAPAFTATLPATIEVVDTPATRERGLSGRAEVPDEYGMLFVFEVDGLYGFWMKEMQVPIDMVWIGADGAIVNIDGSVKPESYPEVFTPPVLVRYVLETRAGYAKEKGWEVGDRFDLSAYRK